ncbi:uncharacterized protein LOC110719064 isoform X2 [Chenopodium quinoa]|uniref:uncharacterized protein LOC110719064 isoform X2 n=1 Tax=Chenopodium quinoa TaxID=63459 RepID=UPI000B78501C|nr:uncharacterized protein LOC110719064 isoform X2 [Chenopodium quinoa]
MKIDDFHKLPVIFVIIPVGLIFLLSGLIINLIQAILYVLVRPLSKDMYRKFNKVVTELLWLETVWLFDWWAGVKVPRRLYTLDELKLTGIEAASLLSPVDTTLGSIERNLQIAAVLGGVAAWNAFELSPQQLFYISLGLLFLWTLDLISFGGGIVGLALDTIGHTISQKYHNRVIQHEAGHFLIAYLLGILPKSYTLSSLEALSKEGSLNVQAGTYFVDFEFVEETNTGKMSSTQQSTYYMDMQKEV